MKLPYSAEWFKAEKKKFAETVLLVPFFEGKIPALRRHVEFLNELGFDCVAFELHDQIALDGRNIFSSDFSFGMKHVWSDQIERMLNEIPGKKIVFSFSNPSASAIEAIARRHAQDVTCLVCDSGPSGDFVKSLVNFFTYYKPLKTSPLRLLASATVSFLWHPKFSATIQDDLAQLPEGFRILSIRGWKDKLITPDMIDKVFEPHPHLYWQKLSLPQAGHLNGLKDFAEDYSPAVSEFLFSTATQL